MRLRISARGRGQAHLPRFMREKFKIEKEGYTSNINAKNKISILKMSYILNILGRSVNSEQS
jgi:hypothetical protein